MTPEAPNGCYTQFPYAQNLDETGYSHRAIYSFYSGSMHVNSAFKVIFRVSNTPIGSERIRQNPELSNGCHSQFLLSENYIA